MKNYQSDISKFLVVLKENNPELQSRQREGRLRLWDKVDQNKKSREFEQRKKIKQPSYVYSAYGKKDN